MTSNDFRCIQMDLKNSLGCSTYHRAAIGGAGEMSPLVWSTATTLELRVGETGWHSSLELGDSRWGCDRRAYAQHERGQGGENG